MRGNWSEQEYRNAGRHRQTRNLLMLRLKEQRRGARVAASALFAVAAMQGIMLEWFSLSSAGLSDKEGFSPLLRWEILAFALTLAAAVVSVAHAAACSAQFRLLALIDELAAKLDDHSQEGHQEIQQ